jgi:ethanolamine utilization microcompartment shell protein EutL
VLEEYYKMVDLRAFVFLDSLQPQFASFQATISKGYLPKVGQASLFVEIAPGMAINQILDVALKSTDVTAGMQIVERHYGMLELHSESQADVRQAGQAILDYLGLEEKDRHKPRVVANQVVRHLEDTQTMLINRFRHGNMILAGQTLFVLEVEPAAYAALAANEAEKAANINILEVRAVGSFGRVYIGGEEQDVVVAHEAATQAIKAVTGKRTKK